MKTFDPLTPDDPRLTTYALGELEDDERAAVEAALATNPALRAVVEEIRATAAELTATLAAEPLAESAQTKQVPWAGAESIAGRDPRKLDGGPAFKWARFPQAYYILGGLAAAAFAILIVRYEPRTHLAPEMKRSVEVNLNPTGIEAKSKTEAGQVTVLDEAAAHPAPPTAVELKDLKKQFSPTYDKKAVTAGPLLAGVEAKSPDPIAGAIDQPRYETFGAPAEPAPGSASALVRSDMLTLSPFEVVSPRKSQINRYVGFLEGRTTDGAMVTGGVVPGRARELNTESYGLHGDNEFIAVASEPRSTFSIDVDTASYSNVRRFLRGGQLPPRDAVRIEELINYFPFHYAARVADVGGVSSPAMDRMRGEGTPPAVREVPPFAASLEVASAPWEPKHRLVRIGLKGREVSQTARPATSLVFLLDISGSMSAPNRLPLVKEAMHLLLSRLRADDRVAIVTYAGKTGLALPSTPVTRSREILAALDELEASGSTDGGMGIQLAYDIAKANFIPDGVNRVILCTDGDFNVGVTNQGDLVRLIQEKAKSKVFLTVLGFGMGNLKDSTLELLADKGNGNYGYIDSRREAEKLLVEQASGTLVTIAKDVKIQVEFNPAQASAYRLIGYEKRLLKKEDFNNDKIDAGEIGAGHTVTALYEVIPAGADEPLPVSSVDELKYQGTGDRGQGTEDRGQRVEGGGRKSGHNPQSAIRDPQSKELLTVNVRYKEPTGDVSRKLEFPLVDGGADFDAASGDFKFAASVAGFGLALRAEPMNGALLADVARWAEAGITDDAGGYRAEFTGLVRQAQALVR